jgi:hypothetical protein
MSYDYQQPGVEGVAAYSTGASISRIPVPGGWLYILTQARAAGLGAVFVPDPEAAEMREKTAKSEATIDPQHLGESLSTLTDDQLVHLRRATYTTQRLREHGRRMVKGRGAAAST